MMNKAARVRFAPSPTGYLHVGGARTALFNWLFVRATGGVFVLRIEDTDRARSSSEMTDAILNGMRWLGLTWDEGPFHQADGLDRHRADALRLLDRGAAYRCFCSAEKLEKRRAAPEGQRSEWDCDCSSTITAGESATRAASGEPFAVRFRVPEGTTEWDDVVHGTTSFANTAIEDFIILRSDGTAVYNMAVVSDDVFMDITHVIRGDDHLSNTPKQIMLYRALGSPLPTFAHLPMILGPDGRRLSKRHGATAVGQYEEMGILPAALVNFLALLGWSSGTDEELFTIDELVARFSLEAINRKSAVFDTQKLLWMNGRYLANVPSGDLADAVASALRDGGHASDAEMRDRDRFLKLLDLLKVRARTVPEIVQMARPFFGDDVALEEAAVAQHWKDAATADRMSRLRDALRALDAWDHSAIEDALRSLAKALGVGAGKLIHPFRVAITGTAASAGIFEVAALLGRDRVLHRLDRALETLRNGATLAPEDA